MAPLAAVDTKVNLYVGFFDKATNLLAGPSGPIPGGPFDVPLSHGLDITGLPTRSPSTVVGLLGLDWGAYGPTGNAIFVAALSSGLTPTAMSGSGTTVTVTLAGHGRSTGDIITLDEGSGFVGNTAAPGRPPARLRSRSLILRTSPSRLQMRHCITTLRPFTCCSKFRTAPQPQASQMSSQIIFGQGINFTPSGTCVLPYMNAPSTALLAASSIGGAQPGYQFYASIYNPATAHVGNRQPLGVRLNNSSACIAVISGLPDLSSIDTEWCLLIGRTSDGAQLPYAVIDNAGNWIYATSGQTSISITQSNIDRQLGTAFHEMASPRNAGCELSTVTTYRRLRAKTLPLLARLPKSGRRAITAAESWRAPRRFTGLVPRKICAKADTSDFPNELGPRRYRNFPHRPTHYIGPGFQQESSVFSDGDSGMLMELSGETQWQGPFQEGGAGQYAWAIGWRGMPYWITKRKQPLHDFSRRICANGGDVPDLECRAGADFR